MTRAEAVEFLANTKVYVNGKSREIQEKLFELGYKWSSGDIEVLYTQKPFLYIYEDMSLAYCSNMEYFSSNEHREISAEEILSLELTETTYRPFKDAKECWNEMLNHEPFGWIKSKNENYLNVLESINNAKNYQYIFDNFTFADGTTFGLKED